MTDRIPYFLWLALLCGICTSCRPGTEPVSELAIAESVDLGKVPVGNSDIHIPVTNSGPAPGRVVGLREGCYKDCCVAVKQDGAVTVPAKGRVEYPVLLHVRAAGPFEQAIEIHLDSGHLRTVAVMLRGVGVAGKDKADGPPDGH